MVQLLCRNRVENFDRWKKVFDRNLETQIDCGLRLAKMWQQIDDPNNVFFIFDCKDVEQAKNMMSAPEAAQSGEESGVIDGECHFITATAGY